MNTQSFSLAEDQLSNPLIRETGMEVFLSAVDCRYCKDRSATSMQRVLEVECQGCTVLAVMHQLQHFERYDLVGLVDEGRIVELESPAAVLAEGSEFSKLYQAQARA
ncbi:hypothetical protein CNMCM5623_000845 [Aspergillus felis]|uniref:Uncharacterized protein n=1 Tax=Aspergillus felis TaxID=1287682 RepID=A0A8H6V966_9EURO|nr:hypothetical protein CNMCM5623_000845 [Aspergillus felis]KAF7182247.1 hypothetical protein CNMCM7691_001726 [Aspergillus felis]